MNEFKCNRTCPALGVVEVEILGQDFRFCQHHYDEMEPALLTVAKALVPA